MDVDTHIPIEPTYYRYKGNDILVTDSIPVLDHYSRIYMCAYDVNNEGVNPFLRFILTNPGFPGAKLGFPAAPNPNGSIENSECVEYVKQWLFILLSQDGKEILPDNIEYTGYYGYNNNIYMFYDITKVKFQTTDIFRSTNIWLALVDEIITHHHVCNIGIDEETCDFLTLNDSFCFLMDETNKNYEIPLVCYVGKSKRQLSFTCMFGTSCSNKNSILGPFYYFVDFFTACKNSPDLKRFISFDNEIKNSVDNTMGLVRFAVFLGVSKFIENRLNDTVDASEIKQQRLVDETLNTHIERLTMRISDHDGIWSQNYNSAFLGDPELDDGSRLNIKLLAVKDYVQQIPLSYHYVNSTTLKHDDKMFMIM